MFHTNNLKIRFDQINEKNMFDLVISSFARKQRKKITCLKHEGDFLKYNPKMSTRSTIYDDYKNADQLQTKYFNRHFL